MVKSRTSCCGTGVGDRVGLGVGVGVGDTVGVGVQVGVGVKVGEGVGVGVDVGVGDMVGPSDVVGAGLKAGVCIGDFVGSVDGLSSFDVCILLKTSAVRLVVAPVTVRTTRVTPVAVHPINNRRNFLMADTIPFIKKIMFTN